MWLSFYNKGYTGEKVESFNDGVLKTGASKVAYECGRRAAQQAEMNAEKAKSGDSAQNVQSGQNTTTENDDAVTATQTQQSALDQYANTSFKINDVTVTQADVEENIQAVSQMESVADMNGTEFAKGEVDLVTQVENYYTQYGGSVYSAVLGDVDIGRNGIKSSLAHGIGRNKAIAYAAVPNVIQQGKIIDFENNWKNRGYDTVALAAPITIGTEPYYAGVINKRN